MFGDVMRDIRDQVDPDTWHLGFQLARAGAVELLGCSQTEWVFSVGDGGARTQVKWTWTGWECGCVRYVYLKSTDCIHIVASAHMLSATGDILRHAAGYVRGSPTKTVYLRSADSSLWISISHRFRNPDGGTYEHLVIGSPYHPDELVRAIPAGATEARLKPKLGRALAPWLAQEPDVRLDGRPVFVETEPLMVHWISVRSGRSFMRLRVPLWPRPDAEFPGSKCALYGGKLRFTQLHEHPRFALTEDQVSSAADLLKHVVSRLPEIERAITESQSPLSAPATPDLAPPGLPASSESPRESAAPRTPDPSPEPPPRTTPPRPAPASTGETTSRRPEASPPTLSPRWKASGEDYDVTFATTGPAGEALELPSSRVVPEWRAGAQTIEVTRGVVAQLPDDWLERYGPILERLHAARDTRGNLQRWGRPVAATLCQALKEVPPPELAGLAGLVDEFAGIPAAELPAGLDVKLRDYQRRGVDWLCLLRDAELGALLADDMGLGKTVQTICALKGRTLVVAPRSTLHNWVAELKRFRPNLKVCLYHGPNRKLNRKATVTVTSYALLRLDRKKLCEPQWGVVVLDEAQAIKEARTITAGAAFALKARWRIALTGTPVENRLTELWSVCHFLNPGLLGTGKAFAAQVARPVEAGSVAELDELKAKLRPFVLRRRKSEVARELPPRTEVMLTCQLDEHERKVYDALRVATHKEVIQHLAAGKGVLEALEHLLRLRQAACHVGLIPGQKATRSSKVDLLLEHLVDITAHGHRALVFSQWTSLLDLLEEPLRAHKLDFARLDGRTKDRETVVARFQAANGPPVMLLSIKAGGVGLNLTAADHVYLIDPWWNPAVEDQAADRTHRIGQDRPVFVHRLIAEDTVEEKILEIHRRKRKLVVNAIDGAQVTNLTRDDLLELLK